MTLKPGEWFSSDQFYVLISIVRTHISFTPAAPRVSITLKSFKRATSFRGSSFGKWIAVFGNCRSEVLLVNVLVVPRLVSLIIIIIIILIIFVLFIRLIDVNPLDLHCWGFLLEAAFFKFGSDACSIKSRDIQSLDVIPSAIKEN